MPDATENQFLGALLGMAIGDALGAPVSGMDRAEIAARFGAIDRFHGLAQPGAEAIHPGEFTDETELALCIVESMTANRRQARRRDRRCADAPSGRWTVPPLDAAGDSGRPGRRGRHARVLRAPGRGWARHRGRRGTRSSGRPHARDRTIRRRPASRRCRGRGPSHPWRTRCIQCRDRGGLRGAPGGHRRGTGVLGARNRRVPRRRGAGRASRRAGPTLPLPTRRCPTPSTGRGRVCRRSNRFRRPSPRL